eukprot:346520-Chlamydomonas_euryale.AAC.1
MDKRCVLLWTKRAQWCIQLGQANGAVPELGLPVHETVPTVHTAWPEGCLYQGKGSVGKEGQRLLRNSYKPGHLPGRLRLCPCSPPLARPCLKNKKSPLLMSVHLAPVHLPSTYPPPTFRPSTWCLST